MPKPQRVEIEAEAGPCVATKAGQDRPWEVADPWGDWQFYGSVPQVQAEIRKRISQLDE